jgi:PST family polysaccharide transporter
MNKIEQDPTALKTAESTNFFETEHLKSNLKARSVRGGAITLTSQVIKFLLETGSTIALARLLTPHDYGLIAMVTAITGFVALFKSMGLSMATIQKEELNHSQVSTLFWLNVAVSLVLVLILSTGAPIISWFYGEPRLTWITLALAGTFLFSGIGVQHGALLSRQMRFRAIALIEIVSVGIGITVGIVLAWYSAGYWALVGLSATTILCSSVLAWVFCRWRPGFPVRSAGIFPMVKFGGHITSFNVINYFARNFDNILLGKFWGAEVLGLYSKAYSIMMLPIEHIRGPLTVVAIPALSHIKSDPIRYKRYYTKLVSLLAFVSMPLVTFLFVHGDQVIYILLGSQWLGAVDIFKILCIAAFTQPEVTTAGLVLISLGQSKRYFVVGTVNSIIAVISFVLGLPWGAMGVAVAYTIASCVTSVPVLWYCFRRSPISMADFFSAILQPVIASIIMGFVILAVRSHLTNVSDIVSIGCSFIIGSLIYFMALFLVPGGLQLLQGLSSYRSFLFKKST